MSAEKAPPQDAPPEAARRRFTPKLLIVAGASALLLLGAAGTAAVWLWPQSPDPAAAKAARIAAKRAAAQAAAAALPASAATAVATAATASAHDASSAPAAAHDSPPAAAADTPAPPLARAAVAEAPLDRLQRRLGEVLGGKGTIQPSPPGELRVVARNPAVVAVRHAQAPAAAAAADRAAPVGKAERAAHWSYSGLGGPQVWGRLKPEFSSCAVGQRQSPIDIRDGIVLDLEPVQFDYQPSGFSVIDNGHTVQVNVAAGNSIEVNGKRFALQQFHFHRPSEERINGRQFEMDAHLVHKDADGRLAVVAVLLERGAAQPLLQTVWNNLPLEKNEEFAARAQIDLNQLLPADRRYYTYMGSLTTPPCSEGVLWLVMQQPVPMSAQQIDIFARLYPMNARPIQAAAGRMIKQSN
jgi:carbonic anhydrase